MSRQLHRKRSTPTSILQPMPIPSTLGLIVKCWQDAENELRASIEEKHPDLDEEFITRLFCDELAFLLRKASSEGTIRQAFLIDLQNAFPEIESDSELASVSDNLIADISLHKREVEKITGGDFGLTITRPQMLFDPPSDWSPHYGHLQITEYQRGLLCQAKIKRRTDKWGSLSKRQKDVFPSRMKYLGLLLYEYSDKERRKLKD